MKRGFTLIELLIVVAIIAILAAIAVPNFLEAQTRSKISRAKSDLRTMTTAMEAYSVDWNKYPFCNYSTYYCVEFNADPARDVLERLSTPQAYLSNALIADPFKPNVKRSGFDATNHQGTVSTAAFNKMYHYVKYAAFAQGSAMVDYTRAVTQGKSPKTYILFFGGPMGYWPAIGSCMRDPGDIPEVVSAQFYDPTNGTVSYGAIYRGGGQAVGAGTPIGATDYSYYGGEFFKGLAAWQK